ncbi:hypothetical protein BDV23DRAFT_177896 [Aspergillus alliaceus]|uniref:Apple domain-containing protein n=1 Tax=Petromyces alliaceus TaxID=209559 RepID=A0A5N7CQ85_PETAA|nr:hypothetical protein BDV23DRAFT_177896 [Aspergillus alliaceus]
MQLQALVPFLPLLASLAAGQSSSTPRAFYNQVCPEKDGQEKKVYSNIYVTYHCNQRPDTSELAVISAASPDDCATICSKRSDCKSVLWAGKETTEGRNSNTPKSCVLYHSLDAPLISESEVVYMTYKVKKGGLFPDDHDKCSDEKAHIDRLQDKVNGLERQLKDCEKGCTKGCFQCPDWDQEHVNDRGHDYKVYCGMLDDEGWDADNVGFKPDRTPKECIQACTDTPKCERAIWPTALASNAKGGCWLRPYTIRAGRVPSKKSGYSSAHLQGTDGNAV